MAELNEVSREIRRAVDTGKIAFGFKQAEKILLSKKAELMVFSSNAQKEDKERIQEYATIAGIPCFIFEGNGLDLGAVCGKPFVISFLTITDFGKSKILDAIKQTESSKAPERKVSKKSAKKKEKKAKKAAEKENEKKTAKPEESEEAESLEETAEES